MQIVWSSGSWWIAFEKVTLVELRARLRALHERKTGMICEGNHCIWHVERKPLDSRSVWLRRHQKSVPEVPLVFFFFLGLWPFLFLASFVVCADFLQIVVCPTSAKTFCLVWLLSSEDVTFTSRHWAWIRVRRNGWIGASAGSVDPQSSTWRICGPDLLLKDFPSNR